MVIESLNEENYIKEKKVINIVWANVFGIIVFILALLIFGIPYIFIWKSHGMDFTLFPIIENTYIRLILFLPIFIIGIIFHEFIHGLFFAIFSEKKFKSIKYGIMPKEKLFTPYCHCTEILKINHYRIAAIMPTIILGIIPAGISLLLGDWTLLFIGSIFICAGSGDILMIMKIVREKNKVLIYDLPDDAGFILYKTKN